MSIAALCVTSFGLGRWTQQFTIDPCKAEIVALEEEIEKARKERSEQAWILERQHDQLLKVVQAMGLTEVMVVAKRAKENSNLDELIEQRKLVNHLFTGC